MKLNSPSSSALCKITFINFPILFLHSAQFTLQTQSLQWTLIMLVVCSVLKKNLVFHFWYGRRNGNAFVKGIELWQFDMWAHTRTRRNPVRIVWRLFETSEICTTFLPDTSKSSRTLHGLVCVLIYSLIFDSEKSFEKYVKLVQQLCFLLNADIDSWNGSLLFIFNVTNASLSWQQVQLCTRITSNGVWLKWTADETFAID